MSKKLVSETLSFKIHALLLAGDRAAEGGNAKGAAAQYVSAGKLLPKGVYVSMWNKLFVLFMEAEKEPEVPGWKESFGGKPFLIMGAR